jgi:sporulation protein YabP
VSGVCDVLSFDLSEILLETDQGMLMIKGSDLHVNRLTLEKGEVDIEGKIDSLTYSDVNGYGGKGESLLGRLFK